MTKALKDKWLKALRSGEYKQTKGTFCREVEGKVCYCVIGVLASLTKIPTSPELMSDYVAIENILETSIMWELISLNDKYGQTFEQLADRVDELV